MTVLAAVLLTVTPIGPDQILSRVQSTYKNAGDVEADFAQVYQDKLLAKTRTEQGHLWTKPDGRVVWQYNKPEHKEFIFDGRSAFFYEPELAQVTVFDAFAESPLANIVRFLTGNGEIQKLFSVGPCVECEVGLPDHLVLALAPKEPLGNLERAWLVVEPKTFRVVKTFVFDALQNRTEYRFSNITFQAQISDSKFVFKTPEGVQELRARSN